MQREHDALEQRVGALETSEASSSSSSSTPIATSGDDATPAKALKVVKLEPAAASATTTGPTTIVSAPGKPEDDDAPRPLLKIGPEGMSETFPDDPAPAKKAKIDPKAGKEYDAALALYKSKKFQQALDGFAGFVLRWPDHANVPNALFWRGECYAALGQWEAAEGQLEGMLASHPTSNKVPEALLELGIVETKLGSASKAKAAFGRLRKEFPKSDAAKKIPPEES